MAKNRKIQVMREKLITIYPSGMIRNQLIADMPDYQIYAIYKSHTKRRIPMNKPRMFRQPQVPGQMNMLSDM